MFLVTAVPLCRTEYLPGPSKLYHDSPVEPVHRVPIRQSVQYHVHPPISYCRLPVILGYLRRWARSAHSTSTAIFPSGKRVFGRGILPRNHPDKNRSFSAKKLCRTQNPAQQKSTPRKQYLKYCHAVSCCTYSCVRRVSLCDKYR